MPTMLAQHKCCTGNFSVVKYRFLPYFIFSYTNTLLNWQNKQPKHKISSIRNINMWRDYYEIHFPLGKISVKFLEMQVLFWMFLP